MRIGEGRNGWGREREARELSLQFPLPPFVTQDVALAPLRNFFRVVLGVSQNVVFVAQGELFTFLQALLLGCLPREEKRVFLCASGDEFHLKQLYEALPPEETVFLLLARRPEEFWSLFTFFTLQDRRKALVGEPHGALAECARECFVPFFPADITCFSFWQRSAFSYLPLVVWGIPVEEVERGFQEGYSLLREAAFLLAFFLAQKEQEGRGRVYIVTESSLLEGVTSSLVPLFERSCGHVMVFRIMDPQAFWNESAERVIWKSSVVIAVRGDSRSGLQVRVPQSFFSTRGPFTGQEFLHHSSFEALEYSTMEALRTLLRREGEIAVDIHLPSVSPLFLGQYMAFLQYFACYSAWIREIDVFSDPPLMHFERQVVSFLKKWHEEETER